VIFNEF